MAINNILRKELNKYPQIKRLLVPVWMNLCNIHWRVFKSLGLPVKYPVGDRIAMLHPEGQIPEVLWKHNFEENERNFLSTYLKTGMQVANIGANVGLYSVLASIIVGSNGRIHAFEPSTVSYSRLKKNLILNGCENVITNQIALSNAKGQLVLRVDPLNPTYDGHNFVEMVKPGDLLQSDETVEATTLDAYMAAQANRTLDLIIMDVEGAELSVLEGGAEAISQPNLTLLMECSKHHDAVKKLLEKDGYSFWVWNANERGLVPADFMEVTRRGDVIARRSGWRA